MALKHVPAPPPPAPDLTTWTPARCAYCLSTVVEVLNLTTTPIDLVVTGTCPTCTRRATSVIQGL